MAMAKPRVFSMPFEPMAIEHLGLRLYSTLPPVVAEFVTNAYDAEAPKVEIILPGGDIDDSSEVRVRDYGLGMNDDELQDEFLPIGRNRRGADSKNVKSKNGKRLVTGRKGLGKLSAFGIADEMEVRSVQDGDATTLRLRFSDMKEWAEKHPKKPYQPEVVAARSGTTSDPSGVEITLRRLRRRKGIDADFLRMSIARRLTLIGAGFVVTVNGTAVKPGDRTRRSQCVKDFSWAASEFPDGASITTGQEVSGWIGFVSNSSQAADRGVDIFAHGKAVELGSYFNYASTHAQFARAHLVGELHADFLDEEEDLASTARTQVVWESVAGQLLQAWGQELLKWAFDEWVKLRKEEKTEKVIKAAKFDEWLKKRSKREQKVAQRMVKLLVDVEELEPEAARPLLEIVKSSVETAAFQELVEAFEEKPSVASLLQLFDEWRVIEAREHLQLAEGRRSALDQLASYMKTGALEVQQIQPLIEKNLWLVEPRWTVAHAQPTYSQLLRKHCKEKAGLATKDRRLDIMGVTNGGELTVLELKRPERTLNIDDLNQLESYVDWARDNIANGSGPDAPTSVRGLIIGGKIAPGTNRKVERMAGHDMRAQTYADLHKFGTTFYLHVEQRLSKIAPEYGKRKKKK